MFIHAHQSSSSSGRNCLTREPSAGPCRPRSGAKAIAERMWRKPSQREDRRFARERSHPTPARPPATPRPPDVSLQSRTPGARPPAVFAAPLPRERTVRVTRRYRSKPFGTSVVRAGSARWTSRLSRAPCLRARPEVEVYTLRR